MKRKIIPLLFISCVSLIACNNPKSSSSETLDPSSSSTVENTFRTINGVVSSYEDENIKIADVEVKIKGSDYVATTNESGAYSIELAEVDSEYSSYTLEFTKDGYAKKTATLKAEDFINSVGTIDVSLITATFSLFGTVTCEEQPVENARVSIVDSEFEALTDAQGYFVLEDLSRFSNEFILSIKCDYYKTKQLIIHDLLSSRVEQNVQLEMNYVNLHGQISDINGVLENAKVSIVYKDAVIGETLTDSEGNYSLNNAAIPENQTYEVRFAKEGYESGEIREQNKLDNEINYVMMKNWANAGYTYHPGDYFSSFTLYLNRDAEHIYFRVDFANGEPFKRGNGERNVSFNLNFDQYGSLPSTTAGSKSIELKAWISDSKNDYAMLLYNQRTSQIVDFATWNDGKTWVDMEGASSNAVTRIEARISLERINATLGENTVNATSSFGFMFTQWNADNPSAPLAGSALVHTSGFDYCGHAGNPQEFFWMDSNNVLTRSQMYNK